jgi:hypothetical protein
MTPAAPLTHTSWCRGPILRSSESIFEVGVVTTRCITCGAKTTAPTKWGQVTT